MTDDTGFLYPFLEAEERDVTGLLTDLADSARGKAAESSALQASSLTALAADLETVGQLMARRLAAGGRLYTFGNGGSSTDAATLAGLFCAPPRGRPLPAWSLTDDQAVLTALGNDVGFELIFSRQIIAHSAASGSQDVAIAMSTSGSSADLVRGLSEAHRRGLLTIGFAGYDGGELAASPAVDFCFTVASQSVHRIQESQAVLGYRLWQLTQAELARLSQEVADA